MSEGMKVVLPVFIFGALVVVATYAGIRSGNEGRARTAKIAVVCDPYAVLGTYNRLGKTMVICAQPDGGTVDREAQ